ncbi:MAG: hypothetical protein R3C14_48820 [Caldilineaceae bacterium]
MGQVIYIHNEEEYQRRMEELARLMGIGPENAQMPVVSGGMTIAIYGSSDLAEGIYGSSNRSFGVYGRTSGNNSAGVFGGSEQGSGVWGETKAAGHSGIYGESKSPDGFGVFGRGRIAGYFQGDVVVTGDIILQNADCAEDFDIETFDLAEPGTVMVLGEEGALQPSQHAYDKRVAGVVSGAGDYKPGIVLDKQHAQGNRKPIALLGKVFCKVDASYGAINVGDLLTTSPTTGHAMKANDPLQAFGAVVGKALRSLKEGQSLIPILIALQ